MPDLKDIPDHFWVYLRQEWGLSRFEYEDASAAFQNVIWEHFNALKPLGAQDH